MDEETKTKIEELNKKIADFDSKLLKFSELENKFSLHKHNGYDNSLEIDGNLRLKPTSFFTIGTSYQANTRLNAGLSNEANRHYLAAGKDSQLSFGNTTENTQLTLEDQPGTTGSTNQSFYYGVRPPLWAESGISITSGGNTLADTKRTWATNILAGAYIDVYDSTGTFKETRVIASNTATVVTITGTWTFTDTSSSYIIFMPVYLGSADFPWRRLYITSDIRFGKGLSAGTDVIWIKFGTATPEGAITANIGSLYMRTDGGTSTTLYVKESGTGNTGWTAVGGEVTATGRSHKTSSQAIADITTTKVVWEVNGFASGITWDGTNNRFTITQAGKYLASSTVLWGNPLQYSPFEIYIYKNGSLHSKNRIQNSTGAGDISSSVNDIIDCAVNDYIEIYVRQASGASVSLGALATECYFSIIKVG